VPKPRQLMAAAMPSASETITDCICRGDQHLYTRGAGSIARRTEAFGRSAATEAIGVFVDGGKEAKGNRKEGV
jgi:hypothetical protein